MLRSAGRVAAVALLALFALGCVSAAAKPSTDRLVAAIKSKNLSAVVDALSVKGLDVNTPDSTRRLPLVEAARSRDARLVGALLDQGALARVSDGTTTPLHLSMQGGSAAIVKLLQKDKTGASARSTAAAVKELADLLKQWDARGAMAFEDEPGAYTASGAPFFFNVETGDTTWELPAALAWTEVIESSSGADGESGSGSEAGPRYFHNTVSGEVAWSAPEGSRHVFVEASAADL